MKIIVLASLPLAGKTTYARTIGQKYSISLYETGKIVLEEVKKRDLSFTPKNIKQVTDECKQISDSYFTEKLIEKIDNTEQNKSAVFVSGIRASSEINVLRSHYGKEHVSIIAFHASMKTRFNRLKNPDRIVVSSETKAEEDILLQNYDNFLARNQKELDYGVGSVIASADYLINTEDKKWPYNNVKKCLRIFEIVINDILDS